jgi:hypothetical protein
MMRGNMRKWIITLNFHIAAWKESAFMHQTIVAHGKMMPINHCINTVIVKTKLLYGNGKI